MDALISALEAFRAHDPQPALLLSLGVIAGSTVLLDFFRAGLMRLLRPQKSVPIPMPRAIFLSIARPLQVLIYILGAWAAGSILLNELPARFQATPLPHRSAAIAVLITVTWGLNRISGVCCQELLSV